MVPWILLIFALFTVLMMASKILSVFLIVGLPPVCTKVRLAEDVGGGQWEEDVRGKQPFHPAMPRVLLSQGLITEAGELGCLVEHSELFGRVTVTPTHSQQQVWKP